MRGAHLAPGLKGIIQVTLHRGVAQFAKHALWRVLSAGEDALVAHLALGQGIIAIVTFRGVALIGRALRSGRRGRGFESRRLD